MQAACRLQCLHHRHLGLLRGGLLPLDGGCQVEAVADEAGEVLLRPGYGRFELRPLLEGVLAVGGVGLRRGQLRHEVRVAAAALERVPRGVEGVHHRRVALLARLQRRHQRVTLAAAQLDRLVQLHLRHPRLHRCDPQARVQQLLRRRHPGQRRHRGAQRLVVHLQHMPGVACVHEHL